MAMEKKIRADQEVIDLAKEYAEVLKKEHGTRFSQADAIRVALKKVLLK